MSEKIIKSLGLDSAISGIYKPKQAWDELVQTSDLKDELKHLEGSKLLALYRVEREGVKDEDVIEHAVLLDPTKPEKPTWVNLHSEKYIDKVAGSKFSVEYSDYTKNNIGLALFTKKDNEGYSDEPAKVDNEVKEAKEPFKARANRWNKSKEKDVDSDMTIIPNPFEPLGLPE